MAWGAPAAMPFSQATSRPRERSRTGSAMPRGGEASRARPDPITSARIEDLQKRLERHADGEEQLLAVLQELRTELKASTEQNRYGIASAEREIRDIHSKVQGSREAAEQFQARYEQLLSEVRDKERELYEAEIELGALQKRLDGKRLEEAAAETALANLTIASSMAESEIEQQLRNNALLESSWLSQKATNDHWKKQVAALRAELDLHSQKFLNLGFQVRAGTELGTKRISVAALGARVTGEDQAEEEVFEGRWGSLGRPEMEASKLSDLFRGFSEVALAERKHRQSIEEEVVRRRSFRLAQSSCRRWHEIASTVQRESTCRRWRPTAGSRWDALHQASQATPPGDSDFSPPLDAYLPATSFAPRLNHFGLSHGLAEDSDLSIAAAASAAAAGPTQPSNRRRAVTAASQSHASPQRSRGYSFLLQLSFAAWCLSIVALPMALLYDDQNHAVAASRGELLPTWMSSLLSLPFAPLFSSSLSPVYAQRLSNLTKFLLNVRKRRVNLIQVSRMRRLFLYWRSWGSRSGTIDTIAMHHFKNSAVRKALLPLKEVLTKRRLRAGLREVWRRGHQALLLSSISAWRTISQRQAGQGLRLTILTRRRRESRKLTLMGKAFRLLAEFTEGSRAKKDLLLARRSADLQAVGWEVLCCWRIEVAVAALSRRAAGRANRRLLAKSFKIWKQHPSELLLKGPRMKGKQQDGCRELLEKVLLLWYGRRQQRSREELGTSEVQKMLLRRQRARYLSSWRIAHQRKTRALRDELRLTLSCEGAATPMARTWQLARATGGNMTRESALQLDLSQKQLPQQQQQHHHHQEQSQQQQQEPHDPAQTGKKSHGSSLPYFAYPPPPDPPLDRLPTSFPTGFGSSSSSPPANPRAPELSHTWLENALGAAELGERDRDRRAVSFQEAQPSPSAAASELAPEHHFSSKWLELPPADPPLKQPFSPPGSASSAYKEARQISSSNSNSNSNGSSKNNDNNRMRLLDRMQAAIHRIATATSKVEGCQREREGVLLLSISKEQNARDELRNRLIPEAEAGSRQSLLQTDARISSMQEELSVVFNEQKRLRESLRSLIDEAGEDRQALQAANSEQHELKHCLEESARICTEAAEARQKQIESLEVYVRKCRGQLVSLEDALEDALQEHAEIQHLQEQAARSSNRGAQDTLQATMNLMSSPVVPDVLLAT